MAAFLSSATIAFLIYELLALIHFPSGRSQYHFWQIRIFIDDSPKLWVRRVLIAVLVIFSLSLTFSVHQPLLSQNFSDAISRNESAIIIGFFFGPLFAIWLNYIISQPPGADLSTLQMVGGVGLILLFLMGAFGNDIATWIRKKSPDINSLTLAGAGLSFATKDRKPGDPGLGALPLKGIEASGGLEYLSGLEGIIDRDIGYVQLFTPSDSKERYRLLTERGFSERVITPIATCLHSWVDARRDNSFATRHLENLATGFRAINSAGLALRKAVYQFALTEAAVASETSAMFQRQNFEDSVGIGCQKLWSYICPGKYTSKEERTDCLAEQLARLRESADAGSDRVNAILMEFDNLSSTDGIIDGIGASPYLAIAHASILAQLGQYRAAAGVLMEWVEDTKKKRTNRWLNVRVRAMSAAYMEEWLRRESISAPLAISNEHADNLDRLRHAMADLLKQAPFVTDPGSIDVNKEIILKEPDSKCTPKELKKRVIYA